MSIISTSACTTSPCREDARRADDQRHVHQLLVDGVAVADAAVLVELVAVVGHDDHRRLLVDAHRLEVGDEARERGVALGDLGVVQRLEVLLVVVGDLELAALDEAQLHARQHRLDRPDVGLVPVLDQELLAAACRRRAARWWRGRRTASWRRSGASQAFAVFHRYSEPLGSDSRMKLRLTSQPRSKPHFDDM